MQIWKSIKSFIPAFKGILETLKEGNNFRIQLLAAVVAIICSSILHVRPIEWCIILLCIAIVLSAELFNTAIENIVDKITLEKQEWARKTKDAAAGAVLVLAIIAFIIALIIWLPYVV